MKAIIEIVVCVLLFLFLWRQSRRFYRRQQMITSINKKIEKKK